MRFMPLDRLINLHDGYRRRFKVDALDLVLAQESGTLYAFSSRCPHQDQSLEDADIEEGTVFCPRHNFAFSLDTGLHTDGFCDAISIYRVHYEGNEVGILLEL